MGLCICWYRYTAKKNERKQNIHSFKKTTFNNVVIILEKEKKSMKNRKGEHNKKKIKGVCCDISCLILKLYKGTCRAMFSGKKATSIIRRITI